ncbi:MAG TPA: DNA-3-methyladenine glycosylase 2 family protein [Candidatus Fournierella merdipullorum]|uniref:DNA-(apurinic or apyrimidinic site) lyase n=1 Tax=Candidatus Allofournierella merdipullorum TaxID=2838595 RepID=A0A9D2E636_9FIRM|nr:DNA-3-methyladenine glycosylase 2 family protein [Candidatus Fournierella merdipullorum]
MDLDATLGCGQTFLWRPLESGGWSGVAAGRAVTARMEGAALILDGAKEEDRAFWENYFALDMDYPALLERFCTGSKRLAACVEHSPGIRVLRQPFFETLCCFIISQNNNIPRIAAITGRLCEGLGRELPGGRFFFPAPEALAAREPEDLAFLRAGWRAEYLIDAARKVASGQVSEAELAALPDAEARELLMTVKGVGPKVADCVLLYSLSRWSVVPMDVWMKRAMARLFPRGAPVCCRPYQGIAQQFIFDYARASLPRGKADKKTAKPRRGD